MMELNNSKERDSRDWNNLFELANKHFRLAGIKTAPKSRLSFIEVIWQGDSPDTL